MRVTRVLQHRIVLGLLLLSLTSLGRSMTPAPAAAMPAPIVGADATPVLAFYYIWFNPDSWNRAKSDIPLLGAYSSDDANVMHQHVRWAKEAGIDGFFVSWKDAESWTPRLMQLVEIAREESFKLSIMYESLDFSRDPLPVEKVTADLGLLAQLFATDPVFDMFGKPVVIWSGIWKYDRTQIEQVTSPLRDRLQILGSQKKAQDYAEIADLVDGNAYYWSSVDPATHPDYPGKLQAMADQVRAYGGLWIAPAAPGFDARHLGGERVVDREDGAVLETEMTTAFSSGPDAVGLISWNEFSENSHIEPSCVYGMRYLSVVAALLGGHAPAAGPKCDQSALDTALAGTTSDLPATSTPVSIGSGAGTSLFEWDSSDPAGHGAIGAPSRRILLLAPFSTLLLFSFVLVVWRSLRRTDALMTSASDNTGRKANPAANTETGDNS